MGRAALVLMLWIAGAAQAERMQILGDYAVHFNAVTSDFLQADVARQFGIQRSRSNALVSVSVLKNSATGVPMEPVEAEIEASAVNLTGQQKSIPLRLVSEQDARYYIGSVRVANQETLTFTLGITLPGEEEPRTLTFSQKFFTQ